MSDLIEEIVRLYQIFFSVVLGVIIIITSPLWILPYMVWERKKVRRNDRQV